MGRNLLVAVARAAKAEEGSLGALASSTNLLVLWALADFANDKDQKCWPSQPTIARATRLSERAVRNAIPALKLDGHISVDVRPGKGAIYTIHPGKTCRAHVKAPRQDVPHPRHQMPVPSQRETPAPGADKPINHNKRTGARDAEPEALRAPDDERVTPDQMADLRRTIEKAAASCRTP